MLHLEMPISVEIGRKYEFVEERCRWAPTSARAVRVKRVVQTEIPKLIQRPLKTFFVALTLFVGALFDTTIKGACRRPQGRVVHLPLPSCVPISLQTFVQYF
ncbi:hypothetical protein CPB86DRAFT_174238 [Serendipita vermifera]|nr:hypothetical protein CPB86DRAFT_174238 [Serendipita vermifera]